MFLGSTRSLLLILELLVKSLQHSLLQVHTHTQPFCLYNKASIYYAAGGMPTGLMAVQEGAGIRVTWSAPASGPAPTSYVVYYQAGSGGIQTTETGSTETLLTDNLVNRAQHVSIEVAALADILGERTGPVTVDFHECTRFVY